MAWLERSRSPLPPGAPPDHAQLAIRAWNLMGGLDWTALPVVAELLGIDDVETLIVQLVTIRNSKRAA